ncbi:uncharacterized protein LOC135197548 [Macrobrachium nipponense]|uniref:uncharacterized protein LOC135197548 n=1 Tax=Macrobrachium nipponense TaxID=159736 RepID=UPI0030C80FCB
MRIWCENSLLFMKAVLAFLLALPIGSASGWSTKGGHDQADDDFRNSDDIQRFAIENGLWTPDPQLLLGPYEEEAPRSLTKARFITANNTVTTVQVGAPAALRCQISNVASHETVSWIRRRDHHLITLGYQTYTNDDRFYVSNSLPLQLPTFEGKVRLEVSRRSGVLVLVSRSSCSGFSWYCSFFVLCASVGVRIICQGFNFVSRSSCSCFSWTASLASILVVSDGETGDNFRVRGNFNWPQLHILERLLTYVARSTSRLQELARIWNKVIYKCLHDKWFHILQVQK